MPNIFPDDHELLAFFGVEPKVLDPNVPWFYNTLEFAVEREGVAVQCKLAPAYGHIDVRLLFGATELARLDIQSFKSLRLHTTSHLGVLIATFDRRQAEETLALMLKPRVWVGLGNFQTIPPGP